MIIKFSITSECGKVRKYNEDNAGTFINKYGMVMGIICDGMGGHFGGQTASRITVNYIKNAFENMNFSINAEFLSKEDIIQWAQNTIDELSIFIKDYADKNKDFIDMGTTLVTAIFFNNLIYILNIGDSRAYYIVNDNIHQITEDHNLQNLLESQGHPEVSGLVGPAHALTSALGPIKKYMLDLFIVQVIEGYVLLASDGFYNFIDEKSIISILKKDISLPEKSKSLIDKAITSSSDNLSIVLFEITSTKENNA